jgi:hypothetical protein
MPGKVEMLSQSYRVPVKVHTLANNIINKVGHRRQKLWLPRQAVGKLSWIEHIGELDPTRLDTSVMMLGRTAKLVKQQFVRYCREQGLPYRHFDANSIKPVFARSIMAWNTLHTGGTIPVTDAVKIYGLLPSEGHKKLKAGIVLGAKAKLNRFAKEREDADLNLNELKTEYGLNVSGTWREVFTEIEPRDADYIQRVLDNGFNLQNKPNIHISTIHRVKGGQANKVIILSDTARTSERFPTTEEDEARVFYTGVTRTFDELVIIHPETRHHFDGLLE